MAEALTNSIQDYLKAIYDLTQIGGTASTNSLANRLGVEPASVTGMVQKLAAARPPLVEYKKHHGVKLTAAGRRAALEVIRHHRLLEAWLVKTLGYSWDEVHTEAEKLEHVISEDLEERIAAALGEPVRDPHGELIPTPDLVMPQDRSVPLGTVETGGKVLVRRVDAHDTGLLRHLEELGLIPGAPVEILEVSPFDQLMHVKIGERREATVIGPAITSRVFVETGRINTK
jgi:DtxR family Mn-dependent transcriptional regulator